MQHFGQLSKEIILALKFEMKLNDLQFYLLDFVWQNPMLDITADIKRPARQTGIMHLQYHQKRGFLHKPSSCYCVSHEIPATERNR